MKHKRVIANYDKDTLFGGLAGASLEPESIEIAPGLILRQTYTHEEFDQTGTDRYGLKVNSSSETIAIFKDGVLSDQHGKDSGRNSLSRQSRPLHRLHRQGKQLHPRERGE